MITSQPLNHTSNFDFLRLFFASLVIVSHSFPLSGENELFVSITNGHESLGGLAVNCFFILSGYFIFLSLKRSKTLKNYLWKRFLRLYPALLVLMVFTLIIISCVYTGSNILTENSFFTYGPNGLSLYKVQYPVRGVFEQNPYPRAINGSLWSLSYEFTLYIALSCMFFVRKNKISLYIIGSVFILSYWLFQR